MTDEQWFDSEECGVSIRVSLNYTSKPFKVGFFDYDAARAYEEGETDKLSNGDRLAPSVSPGDPEFYTNPYWTRQISNKMKDSPKIDMEEDDVDNFMSELCMKAEDVLPGMLKAKEKEGKKKVEEVEGIDEDIEVDEEWVEEKSEEWLESPYLLSNMDRTIHHHLVGETSNAMLTFLTLLSTDTREPGTLRPTGESAIGKSFLTTRVARLFPDDMKIVRKGFSEMAVWNKAEPVEGKEDRRVWSLWGKAMIILEEETADEFLEQFRPILSHDEKKITYEVTDTDSKSRETLKVDIKGWPSYIGMRVGGKMDEQEETRAMKMTPDSGREKYSKAVWWSARKRETPWMDEMREKETEVAKKVIEKLDRYKVLMPFREEIQKYFPTKRKRHMRDWTQFQALVEAMTVLHQRQRPRIEINGEKFLVSHPDDVKAVVMVAKEALAETLIGLDHRLKKFYKAIKEHGKTRGYGQLQERYKECFGESASKSVIRKKYVEPLEDMGMLEITEGSGSRPHTFAATSKLTTLIPDLEKVVESAYDFDFESSTFSLMCSDRGPRNPPYILGCDEWMGENPVEVEDRETFEEFWDGFLEEGSIVEENEELLKRGYEEDYTFTKKKEGKGEGDGEVEIESVEDEPEEPSIEAVEEIGQDELMEELYNLYKEAEAPMDSLDYPHLIDFSERASERLGESEERVLEACERMSEKDDVIFDRSGVAEEKEEVDEVSIEPVDEGERDGDEG